MSPVGDPRFIHFLSIAGAILFLTCICLSFLRVDSVRQAATIIHPEPPLSSLNRTLEQVKYDALHPLEPDAFPTLPPADNEEYIAICLGVRDPDIDISEWFTHYYHHHGIRRFYVIDDGSEPPLSERENIYDIPSSAITFDYISRDERPKDIQKYMFMERCTKPNRGKHTWMGYLDADEFIEMREPNVYKRPKTLVQWLKAWETHPDIGAVAAQWLTHNSNGLEKRPLTSCRKAFTRCIVNDDEGDNKHVKMFAKLDLVEDFESVHWVITGNGTRQVGEHGDDTGPRRFPITHDYWAIHHYGIKSKEQFDEKHARNAALDFPTADDLFDRVNSFDSYDCPVLASYYP